MPKLPNDLKSKPAPESEPTPTNRKLLWHRWEKVDGKDYCITEEGGGRIVKREEVVPRKPAVKITSQWLTIRTEWHKKHGGEYDFRTSRIDSPLKLLNWVHHLNGKVWFDRDTSGELIYKVCKHFGWDLFGGE